MAAHDKRKSVKEKEARSKESSGQEMSREETFKPQEEGKMMEAGQKLLGGLMDMSVLLGVAAGLGVWWFMHEGEAGEVKIKSANMVDRARQGAGNVIGSVSESASSISSSAVERLQGAMGDLSSLVERSPWAFVAGGLLVGSLLAVLIPQTSPENRMLGDIRDQLVDQAQETIQTTVKDTLQNNVVKTAVEVVKNSMGS
jgi:hypothetical protein